MECRLHRDGTYDFGSACRVSLTPRELCEGTKLNGEAIMCKRVNHFLGACENCERCPQSTTYACLACVVCKATG